ncbi:capsule assembly protein Wzi [Algoriphagus boseongensis]|uniref:Capsule assembly protein Wzi n=1 Tax=Algoriphagus boseongensis TaxID=1442587 RepID=A0A4R6T814_9BACT|nr:capsule assembly Wzi family protein [Algoriphagus boseongensis]TDQ19358.1 capsule assembly protein Wzi [Algoriphagus boseongensis]
MRRVLVFIFALVFCQANSQVIPAGFPILEELQRRNQLLSPDSLPYSFLLRPISSNSNYYQETETLELPIESVKGISIGVLPFVNTSRVLTGRQYGWADYGLIPNPGFQTYLSGGMQSRFKFINLTFRPEIVLAQNAGFNTGIRELTNSQLSRRFLLWNVSDFPEKYGEGLYFRPWWGQSKLTFQYGAFEIGGSTENIWWGPGQFNSLTFSNNAQGFPHLTINTTKPAKTFLGNIEIQMVMGKLQNSGLAPSQDQELNDRFFIPFTGDSRYLNAITFTYNPKWIKGFYFGFSRTFHQYNANRGNTFYDWFPIFEGFQKKNFFNNGNSVDFDSNGRDQTITLFGRLVVPKTKSELYFEFGRRDHAFTWREYILNPEHARAFIFGFNQLFEVPDWGKTLQIRAEATHQQESVNYNLRYGPTQGITWHTNITARGFVNYGQPLGVGIGTGSNLQTIEFSLVEGVEKMGVLFERLANNQDFYNKALLQSTQRKPWIDLSIGFLYDKKFDNLLLSSKLQLIHAKNYQWQLDPESTPEFPKGKNLTSVMAQASLIYFWNKK